MSLDFAKFKAELTQNEEKLKEHVIVIKDFCLTHGLIFLSKTFDENNKLSHDLAVPLPVTLHPTKFARTEFNYANELQSHINELTHLISSDYDFLKESLKNVILVDDFTANLWKIYETVYREGISQPISFGILRNDFMLDQNKANNENSLTSLTQIEINTISSSFGSATAFVSKLHRHLFRYTNNDHLIDNHPINENLDVLATGMVKAWELYGNEKAIIAFLVSPNETNIGDQRLLEYKLLDLNDRVKVMRYTLLELDSNAKLDENKKLLVDGFEVAVAYFRVGYDPKDYTSDREWSARLLIERSRAIKCPNIQLHLAGAKIIQQVLCEPNTVERFIQNKDVVNKIRATFVDIHAITHENIDSILKLVDQKCQDYVLKPMREGGGNNIYKEDIRTFVENLTDKNELMGYILMRLVKPYPNENSIIRSASSLNNIQSISELGIYGVYLAKGAEFMLNKTGGYLLRTKSYGTNEGGVASGFSALDSVYLV